MRTCIASAGIVLILAGLPVRAQHGARTLHVLRSQTPPKVDGVLDEAMWRQAEAAAEFVQQEPKVNEPATERTEVRAVLTGDALYFGIHCYDSEAGKIVARERRRDDTFGGDDHFEIVIDTFHDHRNSFNFRTNPLGARYDALITDEGRDTNREWDERWWVEAKISESGWTAEFEIPLTTLRSSSDLDIWGVNFRRSIRRKNEIDLWTAWSRDFQFEQVSQAGHLEGVGGVHAGLRLRVKPYLLGGFRHTVPPSGSGDLKNTSDAGLEVGKFSLTPSLTAEITVNTDFAQVEVDDAVVNLTRFPLFFPEKREFFLERAGILEFGPSGRRGSPQIERNLQMFFPRRIGLTEDRRPMPIVGGAKIIGHVRGLDLGLLNVETDHFEGTPRSNYTVLRIKRNILERSTLGMFFSNRQSGKSDDSNRVAGADANFTFFKNTDVQGFLGRSFTPGAAEGQYVGRAKFNWFTYTYEAYAEHLYVGKEFRHDIGFVQRSGIRRSDGTFVWQPRPEVGGVRGMVTRGEVVYLTDTSNRLLSRQQIFQFSTTFDSLDVGRFNTTHNFEQLERDFPIARQVTVPLEVYGYREYWVEFQSSPRRILASRQRFGWGGFFGGNRRYLQVVPSFKPVSRFSAELSYEYNDVDLPQGSFTTHVANSRFNVNLTNRWLGTALVQYQSESQRLVLFFRLRYIYRPGDDLFIVFNQTSGIGNTPAETDRTLMVKFTRSFDF